METPTLDPPASDTWYARCPFCRRDLGTFDTETESAQAVAKHLDEECDR